MPKLNRIEQDSCRQLEAALKLAVKDIEAKFGVTFSVGNWRYTDRKMRMPVEFNLADTANLEQTHELEFRASACLVGLKGDDFGKIISLWAGRAGKRQFKIVEIKPRSHKYPIICEQIGGRGNGKRYKFSAYDVQMALEKQPSL